MVQKIGRVHIEHDWKARARHSNHQQSASLGEVETLGAPAEVRERAADTTHIERAHSLWTDNWLATQAKYWVQHKLCKLSNRLLEATCSIPLLLCQKVTVLALEHRVGYVRGIVEVVHVA